MVQIKAKKITKTLLWLLATGAWTGFAEEKPAEAQNKDIFYRSYSMEEVLNSTDPRLAQPSIKPVRQALNGTLNGMAQDQVYTRELNELSNQVNDRHEEQQIRLMTGASHLKNSSLDRANAVSDGMTKSSSNFSKRVFARSTGMAHYFEKGLNFDLDLGNAFSSDKAARPQSQLTYGLVEKELVPADAKQLSAANTKEISESELRAAPKSTGKWRMGPKKPNDQLAKQYAAHREEDSKGFAPKPRFKGKIQPKEQPLNAAEENKETGSVAPPMVVTLAQEDQLYRVEYHTKKDLEKEGVRHGVALPVKGTMTVDREMDELFRPTKTSAKNLLIREDAPNLDLHYLNQDERYQSDLKVNSSNYQVNFSAQSASPVKNEGPSYQVGFLKSF